MNFAFIYTILIYRLWIKFVDYVIWTMNTIKLLKIEIWFIYSMLKHQHCTAPSIDDRYNEWSSIWKKNLKQLRETLRWPPSIGMWQFGCQLCPNKAILCLFVWSEIRCYWFACCAVQNNTKPKFKPNENNHRIFSPKIVKSINEVKSK